MEEGIGTLGYVVRLHVVMKYLSQLAIMLAILALTPQIASLFFGEYGFAGR